MSIKPKISEKSDDIATTTQTHVNNPFKLKLTSSSSLGLRPQRLFVRTAFRKALTSRRLPFSIFLSLAHGECRSHETVVVKTDSQVCNSSRRSVGIQLHHKVRKVRVEYFIEPLDHTHVGFTGHFSAYSSGLSIVHSLPFFPRRFQRSDKSLSIPCSLRRPALVQISLNRAAFLCRQIDGIVILHEEWLMSEDLTW